MGTAPVPMLVLGFALPATIGVLANALYNIVDRFFIGRFVGPAGLAAVSVVFPLVLAVEAFSALFSVGAASQISRFLGAGDPRRAERAFSNGLSCSLLFLAVFLPPLLLRLPQRATLCGATGGVTPLTLEYLRITAPAIPAPFITRLLMSTLRAEGHPAPAMWALVVASGLNVALDRLFIMNFSMGVAGAAWGTVLSQMFALLWTAGFYALGRSELRFRLSEFRPYRDCAPEMLFIGSSPFLVNIFFSVMMAMFNVLLGAYGGESALSAMGIFFGIDSLMFLPVMGVAEGTAPVVGYNFGARNFDRVRSAVRLALGAGVLWYTASEVVALIWPEALASFFTTDADVLARTARNLRIGYALMPLGAFAVVGGYVFEALGRARTAFCFNMFRQLSAILLLLALPRLWGTDGVWLTLAGADLIGGVTMACLLRRESRSWDG